MRISDWSSDVCSSDLMFVAAIWFEFVHFAAHTLTEPLATAVFLCAAVLLLRPFAASTRAIFWGGLLLGLTAILRFHYLPAIAVLALFTSGKDVKERWLPLAADRKSTRLNSSH